jgi:hypothetical protein
MDKLGKSARRSPDRPLRRYARSGSRLRGERFPDHEPSTAGKQGDENERGQIRPKARWAGNTVELNASYYR